MDALDEITAFFNLNDIPKKIILQGQQTNGVILVDKEYEEEIAENSRRVAVPEPLGVDYAEVYRNRESVMAKTAQMQSLTDDSSSRLDGMDDLTSIGQTSNIFELEEETLNQMYDNYTSRKRDTANLPIDEMKDYIINNISTNQTVVISGPTGCGKTTQVPQWILDNCYERRVQCNIVVTQPRRIAAISIAHRVCQERGWELGKMVGYQVGLDSKTSVNTRLQYVTTGVLLQKLVSIQNMTQYTHIILDEVHERGQEMDFLMIIVRRLLATNSRNVKLILMSATIDVDKFVDYFSLTDMPVIVNVSAKSQLYSVSEFYLDHIHKLGAIPEIKEDEPGILPATYMMALKLLQAFESIDSGENDIGDPDEANEVPSVLVFLPGINEIDDMYKLLSEKSNKTSSRIQWKPIALHSSVTSAEQSQVFIKAPPGYRKVILSTNIAESSITVPDVKYVIDFCLSRVLVTDRSTGFSSLQLEWASKTSTIQRAGRAGRVRDGRVYRLVTKSFYDNLVDEPTPEMIRCPLERLVLLAKMVNMGSPMSILALAMDPPDLSNITRTILMLKEVGGMLPTFSGSYSTEDGDITYLGRLMSTLPLDVHVSKLIILGYIFGCLEECIIMGATMSVRNIFSTPFQERLNSYNTKLTWADRSASDCIAYLNVYKVWEQLSRSNLWASNGAKRWARQTFVSERALREARILTDEIQRRLQREGLLPSVTRSIWNDREKALILKVVLAGAFYPHLFVLPGMHTGREDELPNAWKELCGRDARNTVYLTGWDPHQPQQLYVNEIKKLFKPCVQDINDVGVSFDSNSSKVFVSFPREGAAPQKLNVKNPKDPNIPGQIVLPVYKALKMKQLRIPLAVRVMPARKAKQYAEEAGIPLGGDSSFEQGSTSQGQEEQDNFTIPSAKLPDVDDTYMDLKISFMLDCGQFYAQYADNVSNDMLILIDLTLNSNSLLPMKKSLFVGMSCAAPFAEGNEEPRYYRARIEGFQADDMVKVQFVDYGNYANVKKSDLRSLFRKPHMRNNNACGVEQTSEYACEEYELDSLPDNHEPPALAILCTLAEIGPSVTKDYSLSWTNEANIEFHKMINNKKVMGKVYSVAHGIVALELFVNNINVNDFLVSRGFAQRAEETYASKLNHNMRHNAQDMQPKEKLALNKEQERANSKISLSYKVPEVDPQQLTHTVLLKGPFSPLECSVRGVLRNIRDCSVGIEWNSVNSVVLNNNPPDIFDRVMVSSCVNQSTNGNLTLRNTSLLPALGGLGAIIALLFGPVARLRRAPGRQRYSGALVGLGADGLGISHHPEHDMFINFDVEMDNDDLQHINHLRYLMNQMLMTGEGEDEPSIEDASKTQVLDIIKKIFLKLMTRHRSPCNPSFVKNQWRWPRKALPRSQRLVSEDTDDSDPEDVHDPPTFTMDNRALYPLHYGLQLAPKINNYTIDMSKNNQKLHEFARSADFKSKSASSTMACSLCGSDQMTRSTMRIHLQSIYHKEIESKLPVLREV